MAVVESYGSIWLSTNSGNSWQEDTTVGSAQYWTGIASNANGDRLVAAVTGGRLWTLDAASPLAPTTDPLLATWQPDTGVSRARVGRAHSPQSRNVSNVHESTVEFTEYELTRLAPSEVSTNQDSPLSTYWGSPGPTVGLSCPVLSAQVPENKKWIDVTSSADGSKLVAVVTASSSDPWMGGNVWTANVDPQGRGSTSSETNTHSHSTQQGARAECHVCVTQELRASFASRSCQIWK